jgi:hypothetical protein
VGTVTAYGINYSTRQSIELDGGTATGTFTAYRPAMFYKSATESTTNFIDASAEL